MLSAWFAVSSSTSTVSVVIAGDVDPLVHVVCDELVLQKVRFGPLWDLLLIGAREQQRRRVRGRPPQRVSRNGSPQSRQQLIAQRFGVEPCTTQLDDRLRRVPAPDVAGHFPGISFGVET